MLVVAAFFLGLAFIADGRLETRRTWRVGRYIVRRELWSSECLARGVGPWSYDGGEEWFPEELHEVEKRMSFYAEEFALRCQLPPYDPDAPPQGATRLVESRWLRLQSPIRSGAFVYDVMQLQVWDTM